MSRRMKHPKDFIWWFVVVDKTHFNSLKGEDDNTWLVKAKLRHEAIEFVEKEHQPGCKVLSIRPATDSEYLDAVRVL